MRAKKGVLIVRASEKTPWRSLQDISDGFEEAYLRLPRKRFEVRVVRLSRTPTRSQIRRLRSIANKRTDWTIVFVDHHLPHRTLLMAFDSLVPQARFIVHAYSDVVSRASTWLQFANSLEGRFAKFVCGSHRQVRLLGRFLGDRACARIPFPVADSFFKPSTRAAGDKIVYAGRLSKQKNVKELVEICESIEGAELDLVGWFSSDENRFLERDHAAKEGESWWKKRKSSKPIRHLGKVDGLHLRNLLREARLNVSLSTYLFEEFGMSIAQGLACGTPAIVTDWGGHGEFLAVPGVNSIAVKIEDGLPKPDLVDARRAISEALSRKPDDRIRKAISNRASKLFGIDAVSRNLGRLTDSKFERYPGPTSKMTELATLLVRTDGRLFSKSRREVRGVLELYLRDR